MASEGGDAVGATVVSLASMRGQRTATIVFFFCIPGTAVYLLRMGAVLTKASCRTILFAFRHLFAYVQVEDEHPEWLRATASEEDGTRAGGEEDSSARGSGVPEDLHDYHIS